MLTEQQIITRLRDLGHLWHVAEGDLDQLRLTDQEAKDGVRSYQELMADEFAWRVGVMHNRPPVFDGEWGPATDLTIQADRYCPLPDIAPPPNATFHYSDPDIQIAVEKMQASAATGSGSWPANCHRDLGRGHVVTFHVDDRRKPNGQSFDGPRDMCIAAYLEVNVLMVQVDDPDHADIHVSWRPLSGSTIGLAEFNNQSCRDTVFCYLDPNYWPSDHQVARLLLHEWGHNHNLPHTRGGIMHPSMLSGFPGWSGSDPSLPRLERFYGPGPYELPDDPPDDPEPPAEDDLEITVSVPGYHTGTIVLEREGGIRW